MNEARCPIFLGRFAAIGRGNHEEFSPGDPVHIAGFRSGSFQLSGAGFCRSARRYSSLKLGTRFDVNECGGCHGMPGKPGHADVLYPPIPQLAASGTTYTESQIFFVAKHRVQMSGMFANGRWDNDQKLWTVAAYIYRIKSLPPHVQQELAKPETPK
jgi:cytochrome c553